MTYNVELTGIAPGVAEAEAVRQLAAKFRMGIPAAERMLRSVPVVIKKNVDLQTAARFEAALRQCGCLSKAVDIEQDLQIDAPEPAADRNAAGPRPVHSTAIEGLPEYYKKKFAKFEEAGGEFKPTLNLAAFLFGLFWYFYRGMWGKGAVLFVISAMSAGLLYPVGMLYAAFAANYDLYLLRRFRSQLWSRKGPPVPLGDVSSSKGTKGKRPWTVSRPIGIAAVAMVVLVIAATSLRNLHETDTVAVRSAPAPAQQNAPKPPTLIAAQPAAPVMSAVVFRDSTESVTVRAGKISLLNDDANLKSQVALNGAPVKDAEGSQLSIKHVFRLKQEDAILFEESGLGTSCPASYFVLGITPEGKVSYNHEVGNCSDLLKAGTDGVARMRFDLPQMTGPGEETWLISGGRLTHQTPQPARVEFDPAAVIGEWQCESTDASGISSQTFFLFRTDGLFAYQVGKNLQMRGYDLKFSGPAGTVTITEVSRQGGVQGASLPTVLTFDRDPRNGVAFEMEINGREVVRSKNRCSSMSNGAAKAASPSSQTPSTGAVKQEAAAPVPTRVEQQMRQNEQMACVAAQERCYEKTGPGAVQRCLQALSMVRGC